VEEASPEGTFGLNLAVSSRVVKQKTRALNCWIQQDPLVEGRRDGPFEYSVRFSVCKNK